MDTVSLAGGATLGPHGVILPAASIGERATIGPASLVMRGETYRRRPAGPATRSPPGRPPARDRHDGTAGAAPVVRGRVRRRGRPLPAHPRQRRLHGQPLRTRPGLPGRQQPAAGRARLARHRDPAARPAQPRPGRPPGGQGDGQRPPRGPLTQRGGKLTSGWRRRWPSGPVSCSTSSTRGARVRPVGTWGEVGWEELTDGVIVAGQPDGAPSWFPCNDRPERQGELPHRRDHRCRLPRRGQRRADRAGRRWRAASAGSTSSASRWRRTWPPSRSGGTR